MRKHLARLALVLLVTPSSRARRNKSTATALPRQPRPKPRQLLSRLVLPRVHDAAHRQAAVLVPVVPSSATYAPHPRGQGASPTSNYCERNQRGPGFCLTTFEDETRCLVERHHGHVLPSDGHARGRVKDSVCLPQPAAAAGQPRVSRTRNARDCRARNGDGPEDRGARRERARHPAKLLGARNFSARARQIHERAWGSSGAHGHGASLHHAHGMPGEGSGNARSCGCRCR